MSKSKEIRLFSDVIPKETTPSSNLIEPMLTKNYQYIYCPPLFLSKAVCVDSDIYILCVSFFFVIVLLCNKYAIVSGPDNSYRTQLIKPKLWQKLGLGS